MRNHSRALGLTFTAGILAALGLISPVTTPPARADFDLDSLLDWFSPAGADLSLSAADVPGTDISWGETLNEFWLGANVEDGLHGQLESLLNNNLWWLNPINNAFAFDNHCGLICNGADGIDGGTLAQAAGQGGGL